MNFNSFNLHSRVLAGIPKNYTVPTPIQAKAIPVIMEGHDILGLAQTGTGKTAAFMLPILHRLAEGPRGKVRALVLAPTRELAEQINDCVRELGAKTDIRSVTVYGGVSMGAQVHKLRAGVDIVVACPGRLLDHINQNTIKLKDLQMLVLDEADQMFDMGFLPTIRQILKVLPKSRQTLLFSATMPDEVSGLAHEILRKPTKIEIGSRAPVTTVAHALYPVDQGGKTDVLLEVLKKAGTGSVLIFTRTKHRAKKLGIVLERSGYKAASLQGNLSQYKRQLAMDGFRSGRYQVLVATDIAARGIDVNNVTHVINYDMPATVEAYTHRIGRTGRAEKTGDALTFVTHEDEGLVRAIERVLGARIERKEVVGMARTQTPERAPSQRRGGYSRQRPFGGRSSRRGDRNGRQERRHEGGERSYQRA